MGQDLYIEESIRFPKMIDLTCCFLLCVIRLTRNRETNKETFSENNKEWKGHTISLFDKLQVIQTRFSEITSRYNYLF